MYIISEMYNWDWDVSCMWTMNASIWRCICALWYGNLLSGVVEYQVEASLIAVYRMQLNQRDIFWGVENLNQ